MKSFSGRRRPEQSESAARWARNGARAGTTDEAAAFGDLLVWTMREPDPGKVLAKPALLAGKVIVDVNNRDYSVEARTGAWFKESIAERLQNAAPDAQVVKAFNTIAMGSFDTSPHVLSEAAAQTFIAGRDAAAKATVTTIAAELGFETIDVGGSVAALRATEALGDVIRLLMIDGGRGVRAHLTLKSLPDPDLNTIGPAQASNYA